MDWKTIFGGAAIFTTIGLVWDKIRFFFSYITSFAIETVVIDSNILKGMLIYFTETGEYKKLAFQPSYFWGANLFVKPVKRNLMVGIEDYKDNTKTFFRKGLKILIIGANSSDNTDNGRLRTKSEASGAVSISFIRGTINVRELIIVALDKYNEKEKSLRKGNRFYVRKHFGSGNLKARNYSNESMVDPPAEAKGIGSREDTFIFMGDKKFLKWKADELGQEQEGKKPLNILAFPEEVYGFVEEINRWKESEDWYREKSIPWKRGWLLFGAPGTGKSALVRALGQYFDLPIHMFDLSTMSNREFDSNWSEALSHVPCIILIEDIDAVFKGRDNRLGENGGGLSFDCFLNCISGIQKADGVFLIITTNNVADLDDALGKPRTDKHVNGTCISTRPGRIDRTLELKTLDDKCRKKIAERILSGCQELIEKTVADGEGDTGAQFQERCSQIALKNFWEKSENNKPISSV